MRSKLSRNSITTIVVLYLLVGFIFLINVPDFLTTKENFEYLYILFSYYVVGMIWIRHIDRHGFFIFEPATMVMSLTFITFSVEPMISMIQNDMGIGSFYVFDGCFKATTIYIIAAVTFLFSYYKGTRQFEIESSEEKEVYEYGNKNFYIAFLIWLLAFLVQIVDLIANGYSIQYIFSLGSTGSMENAEGGLGIFGNIRYFMVTALLYMDIYAKNKKTVWLCRGLSILLAMLRGYRWIIIVYVLSPIVLYAYVKKKSPRLKNIVVLAIIMMVFVGAMQFVRTSLREGNGLGNYNQELNFNLSYIWGAFQGNFDLYKTLYGAVTYFPSSAFYTLGQQMIYLTIVTIIPRSIWPSKPYSIIDSVYKVHFMGEGAVRGHWAYAQLTEFYIEFGIIGVIVCMYIFGRFCKYLRELPLYQNRTVHDVVTASFFFPMLMQLVIRGYMPLNFWPVVFILLPVFIMKHGFSKHDPI